MLIKEYSKLPEKSHIYTTLAEVTEEKQDDENTSGGNYLQILT